MHDDLADFSARLDYILSIAAHDRLVSEPSSAREAWLRIAHCSSSAILPPAGRYTCCCTRIAASRGCRRFRGFPQFGRVAAGATSQVLLPDCSELVNWKGELGSRSGPSKTQG